MPQIDVQEGLQWRRADLQVGFQPRADPAGKSIEGVIVDAGERVAGVVQVDVLPNHLGLWFQRPATAEREGIAAFQRGGKHIAIKLGADAPV